MKQIYINAAIFFYISGELAYFTEKKEHFDEQQNEAASPSSLPPVQMIEGSSMKTYDSIQKLMNEKSHLKQAMSTADRLRLFPTLHRLNSNKRPTPQTAKISSLPEEAEDEVHDTRL